MSIFNKLLNWFRRPKWEEFRDDHVWFDNNGQPSTTGRPYGHIVTMPALAEWSDPTPQATIVNCNLAVREDDTWLSDALAGRAWKLDGYAVIPKERLTDKNFTAKADKIDQTRYAPGTVVYLDEHGNPKHPGEQWRTNFSLTAAQRSERSRKAAATRKANKSAALSQEDRE